MAPASNRRGWRTLIVLVVCSLVSGFGVSAAQEEPPPVLLTVTKTATPSVIHAGEDVTYDITVTNGSSLPYRIDVTDDHLGTLATGYVLDNGATHTFSVAVPVYADVTNTVSVLGLEISDVIPTPVVVTAEASVDVLNPGIAVSKTPSVTEAQSGDIVEYEFVVTNTGDTPLVVEVEDTVFGVLFSDAVLDAGEFVVLTDEHHVYATVTNTVTAVGWDDLGLRLEASASATVVVAGDDATPPVFVEGPTVTDITSDSATVEWQTDEPADSGVGYDARAGRLDSETSDSAMVTDHVVILDGLQPGTTYRFVASSTDTSGNRAESLARTFETLPETDGEPLAPMLRVLDTWFGAAPVLVELADIGTADRVELFIDGDFAYADHSPPFAFNVDSTILTDGPHQITTRAVDSFGDYADDIATVDVDNLTDAADPLVSITSPTTDEDVSGKIDVKVDLSDDVGLFKGTLRVDGDWAGDWYPDAGKPATSLSIAYPWDTRLETNDKHRVAFEMFDTDLNYAVDFVDVVVNNTPPPPPPKLAVSRSVFRTGNYFTIDLTVKNVGGSPALDVSLQDRLALFQPISRTTSTVTYTASYNPELTSWRMRIDDTVDLGEGRSRTYRYEAVPVMVHPGSPTPLIGGDKYSASLGATNTWHYDGEGQNYYDVHHLLYSPSQTGSSYGDALAAADYLLATSPENLFRLNPEDDTNALLSSMARLARLENGVLGYLDVPASFPFPIQQYDTIAIGDVTGDDRAEVVTGEVSTNKLTASGIPTSPLAITSTISYEVKWGAEPAFIAGYNEQGLELGDGVVVGRVLPSSKAQIVMSDASEDAFIAYDATGKRQGTYIISEGGVIRDVESFDGLAAGNVVPGGIDELVFADRSTDQVYVVQFLAAYPSDPWTTKRQLSVTTTFSKDFEAHDGLAVGDVQGDATEEIVVADRSSNRIYIFSYTGTLLGQFPKTFDEGDGLAVANAVYTYPDKAEIVISDASTDRIDAYTANGTLLGSVDRDVEKFDGLAAGTVTGGTVAEVVVADRSADHLDFHNLFRQSADKYVLRDLLAAEFSLNFWSGPIGVQATGAWSKRLTSDYVTDGYLLIVGESDIVPTWRGEVFGTVYTTMGHVPLVADITDYPYASTWGEEIVPELAMGRIIGNTASELRKPIEVAIGVATGASGYAFDRSHALSVSGFPAGMNGTSDNIDFASEALKVALIMKNAGIDPIYMNTPDYTVWADDETVDQGATRAAVVAKFFANTPNKDVVFLAGHGNGDHWDVITYAAILQQVAPFGAANPFVFASACVTGQFSHLYSVANAFLSRGAAAYVGATKWGLGTHSAISKQLFGMWDAGESVGDVMREVKQTIGFDVYPPLPFGGGTETVVPDIKEQYWSAIYHLFGDPKFGTQGPPASAAAASSGGTTSALTTPVATVTIEVPGFEVEELADRTQVVIPGGGLLVPDQAPPVPYFSVVSDVPAGYEVQNVVMIDRAEPEVIDGIVIDPVIEAIPSLATVVGAAEGDAAALPDMAFGWDVVTGPSGDRLSISVLPVLYEEATSSLEFFDRYVFEVVTAPSATEIRRLDTDRQVYGLDPVTGTVSFGDGEHGSIPPTGRDVVAAVSVRHRATGVLVEGLPLRTLHAVRGDGEFAFEWQPSEGSSGDYEIEVELTTADGVLLDRAVAAVTVDIAGPAVAACDAQPATIVGTEGDDVLYGTPGNDVIVGLGGDDVIVGGGGDDVICGGPGDDVIDGGPGDDILDGGGGDDVVDPGLGVDSMSGGAGTDLARIDGDRSGVTVDLATGLAFGLGGLEATLVGFENLTGGPGPDRLRGDSGPNTINGASGHDVIEGSGGDDKLIGASGNDDIAGGEGDDTVLAGNNDDVVYGGPGDDVLNGQHGDDTLYGEEGNDELDGGPGKDLLIGGPGDDHANGGSGRDSCDAEVMRRC